MTRTINTVNIFVFTFVLILVITCLIIYRILNPEYDSIKYNYTSFPKISPVDVKYNNTTANLCKDVIQKCNPSDKNSCDMCNSGEYECTSVDANESSVINGVKLTEGNWCLPKGKKELGCGTYTGRAVWSDVDGEKKWTCVCLYPDLFAGNDCNTQLACRDYSTNASNIDQTGNVLISDDGEIWNPLDPNFIPKESSPYVKDKDNNPIYKCLCTGNSDITPYKFVRLPEDPYRCHLDPCDTRYHLGGLDLQKGECICTNISPNLYSHSNVNGLCYLQTEFCNWDDDKQTCKCSENSSVQLCNSNFMNRENVTSICNDNPGGSYCSNPCSSCVKENSGNPVKIVNNNGTICNCNCKSGYNGINCESTCFTKGKRVDGHSKTSVCCSNSIKRTRKYDPNTGKYYNYYSCN